MFYIKHGNDEIQCTLIEKKRHFAHGFPYKVNFQRFINGRPNLLTLPIKMSAQQLNPLIRDLNFDFTQHFHEVQVWTEHDEFPPLIEIDTRLITHFEPFRYFELAQILPEGMWLHRKYDRCMYSAIASMHENFNYILASRMFPLDEESGSKQQGDEKTQMALHNMVETNKQKELIAQKKERNMPFSVASAKKILSIKSEGADVKAFRNSFKKGAKKDKKKEPKKAE